MRGSTIGAFISMGIGLCVVAGDVGCAARTSSHGFAGGGSATATAAAKPILDNVPASELTAQHYGIKTWKVFVGKSQMVYEGYDVNGKPIEGCQVAWFKPAQNTPAHLRVMVLDGTAASLRLFGPTTTGHFSGSQAQFLMHIGYDFQQVMANPGSLTGSSANGIPIHEDWTWVGVGSYVAAGAAAVAAVAGAPITAGVLGVAAAGMGLYSYVTENPNPSTPPSQVSDVTADPESGQLTETPTQDSPSSQTFDQQWNQDMDSLDQTQTCPSCTDPSGDLNVNPQNGDVSSGSPDDPSNPGSSSGASGSSTSDGSDPGASDQNGTPTPSSGGPSTGSSSGGTGDDGSGDASQDQGTQDQGTQDQGTQDQGTQDQAAQDQGTQDQSSQDQASQDQGSQDASQDEGEDALRVRHHHRRHHHHRHHPKTAWGRIYNWLQTQYQAPQEAPQQ